MKHQTHPNLSLLPRLLAFGLFLCLAHAALAQQRGGNNGQYGGQRNSNYSSSSSSSQTDGSRTMGTAVIDYDPDTGSVMVITDEETNKQIKKVVENLDRPVPQVLIKVLFLEVSHTNDLDLGVEGTLNFDHNNDTHKISTVFGLANETQGGFYKVLDGDLQATIRAISQKTKLEVLSRPSILARNNQQASITVGQRIPFITNTRVTSDGQTLNDYVYSDVGIILNVTPHIAPNRMVEMAVTPEISALTGETVPISPSFNARVIDERSADTRVLVGDGKTVVIGGMMGNNNTDTVKKVPLLGDIPYLGALFRRTVKEKTKTELLIFLTPVVVDNPKELQGASDAERDNSRLAPQAFTPDEMDQFLNTPDNKAAPEDKNAPNAGTESSDAAQPDNKATDLATDKSEPIGNNESNGQDASIGKIAKQHTADPNSGADSNGNGGGPGGEIPVPMPMPMPGGPGGPQPEGPQPPAE